MNSHGRAFCLLPLVALCASCTLLPRPAAAPVTLAFPPVTARPRPGSPLPPLVIFPVRAPSWLATRLLYVRRAGDLAIRARRDAVWIASLPGLLSTALREDLIPHERPGEARIALHVRLFDLEETVARNRARVVLVARTRLVSLVPTVPSRVRLWRLETRTGPGARAEARATVILDRRFDNDVLDWIVRSTAGRPTVVLPPVR